MLIKVWTKSNCVQCEQTKKQFTKLGINYEEHNLEENIEQLEEFKEQGLMSAPVIETPLGNWSGFRVDKIHDLSIAIKAKEGR